jgi:hypothetical protein
LPATQTSWGHGSTSFHSNATTAGDWHIRTVDAGRAICISYRCVLQFPGGFGTGDSKTASQIIDKAIYSQTMGMFTDIFAALGPVYVALKNELSRRGDPRVGEPDYVISKLKTFYDKKAGYAENIALMQAAL